MTYQELKKVVRQGKTGVLPRFTGYFKWNYNEDYLEFQNGDFKCPAEMLEIQNRNDFYYIT